MSLREIWLEAVTASGARREQAAAQLHAAVAAHARSVCGSRGMRDAADDVTQTVVIKLLTLQPERGGSVQCFDGYVRRTVRNALLDRYRREARHREALAGTDEEHDGRLDAHAARQDATDGTEAEHTDTAAVQRRVCAALDWFRQLMPDAHAAVHGRAMRSDAVAGLALPFALHHDLVMGATTLANWYDQQTTVPETDNPDASPAARARQRAALHKQVSRFRHRALELLQHPEAHVLLDRGAVPGPDEELGEDEETDLVAANIRLLETLFVFYGRTAGDDETESA